MLLCFLPNLNPTGPSVSKLLVNIKITYVFIFTFLFSNSKSFYEGFYEARKAIAKSFWEASKRYENKNLH